MKQYIFLILTAILFLGNIGAQEDQVDIPFESGTNEKALNIKIFQGEINIKGVDRSDVSVKYKVIEREEDVQIGDKDDEGLKKISGGNLDLQMTRDGNIVQIQSHNWNSNIHFDIEVPKSIELNVHKNIGGNINISDVSGNINVENNVGDITIKNVNGVANASTNAGNILCHFQNISAAKNMLFTSTTGKIDIALPKQFAASLKLKTDMGDIYSDLDLQIEKQPQETKSSDSEGNFRYFHSDHTLATINGGGPELTIKSKLGSIYLRASK